MDKKNLQRVLLENNISYETFNRTWQVMPESCKNFLIEKWGLNGSEYCKTITQLSKKSGKTYSETFKQQVYAMSTFEKCRKLINVFPDTYHSEKDVNNAWGLLYLMEFIFKEIPEGNFMQLRNRIIDEFLQLLPENEGLYLIKKYLHSEGLPSSEECRLLEYTAIKDLKALVAVK